jgi:hypothetical protein
MIRSDKRGLPGTLSSSSTNADRGLLGRNSFRAGDSPAPSAVTGNKRLKRLFPESMPRLRRNRDVPPSTTGLRMNQRSSKLFKLTFTMVPDRSFGPVGPTSQDLLSDTHRLPAAVQSSPLVSASLCGTSSARCSSAFKPARTRSWATDRRPPQAPHASKSAAIPSSAPWPVPPQPFSNQIFRNVSEGERPVFNNIC